MNESLEALIEQVKKLQHSVDENNAMLISIQRRARLSILLSSLKWLVILGLTFGSFYFIQPYLEQLTSAYSSLDSLSNTLSGQSVNANPEDVNQADGLVNAVRSYMPR